MYLASTFDTPRARQAIAATQSIIRCHSRTFYLATGLLPATARKAIRSLYAFCRATDDLVDREQASLADVQAWRSATDLPWMEQDNPVLASWGLVREAYAVDRKYEQELIDGVAMDLEVNRYATWEDLQTYCYRVASTVGLLSIPIIGLARGVSFEQAQPFATRLGIALQLTNILRDVGEDARHNRVYLPLDELAAFGLTDQDILRGVHDERFIALMRFQIQRARELYREALPGLAALSASARPAVGAAALLYRAILDEIEAISYQVYRLRAHTRGWKKLYLLPGILVKVYTVQT